MGGTVGANPRVQNQVQAQSVQAPDALQAAAGPASVNLTDTPVVAATASAPGTVTADPSVSTTVVVIHDGKSATLSSTASTVGDLLQRMGLRVGTLDKVVPPLTASLAGIAVVKIVRVTQTTERQNIEVPFKQTVKRSDKIELGVVASSQSGLNGLTQKIFRKTYHDGQLVSTVLSATQVVRAPRDEVKLIGTYEPTFVSHGDSQSGLASWYGIGGLSSASPTLPFGTVVKVTNTANGRSVNVVIRDRGPFAGSDRVIDLSPTALAQIGALGSGIVSVTLQW